MRHMFNGSMEQFHASEFRKQCGHSELDHQENCIRCIQRWKHEFWGVVLVEFLPDGKGWIPYIPVSEESYDKMLQEFHPMNQ